MKRWALHPFTLRQLQYVLAVAEHRNFRRAAEACAIAQPSLSTQVAQVEAALGITLFERLPRGVVVTAAGESVIERARRLLLDADDLVVTAEQKRDPLAATLRIGVIPTVAPYLLPELAPVLHRKYPRLQLLWIEEKTRELVVRIESGELDAGILALESDLGELEHARDESLDARADGRGRRGNHAPSDDRSEDGEPREGARRAAVRAPWALPDARAGVAEDCAVGRGVARARADDAPRRRTGALIASSYQRHRHEVLVSIGRVF